MTSVEQPEKEDVVGIGVHAAAITKFLWGVAATLVGAFVIASISFAWHVNSNCVEFREILTTIRSDDARTAAELERLRERVDKLPPSTELVGLRADVSQLQFTAVSTTQALNGLTSQVRDLHPWPVSPRRKATSEQDP